MSNKGTAIFRNSVADYLNVGSEDEPDNQVMNVFETVDEEPAAQTVQKHYTSDASATTLTTGYQTKFPLTGSLYKNNKVIEYIRDIAEEQKLGVQTDYYRVRLYQPIPNKQNTFYARKFRVGFAISKVSGKGGEQITIEGDMNAIGDVTIGEFNTVTRVFTTDSNVVPPDESASLEKGEK